MLLHYIELISEYQDTRRSEYVGGPSSDTVTPQQDTLDMPPPPELVQSIRSAVGDLAACDAVILHNLQQLSQRTGRDVILYAGAFRHGDRGPSPDVVINEDDIASFGDILDRLNRQDEFPNPNLTFHPLPHRAHTEAPYSATRPRGHRSQPGMAGHDNPQLDLILHSPGGTLPATQAIVKALIGRYEHIRVLVPQRACRRPPCWPAPPTRSS